MYIDINVQPAFYEMINTNSSQEELRHEVIDIHNNGTASLVHVFNQMKVATLDKLTLMAKDYSTTENTVVVSNEELKVL